MTRGRGPKRWQRTVAGGTLECQESRDDLGQVIHYRFAFRLPGWGPLDHLRFDHDPAGREPSHVDMKFGSRLMDDGEVIALVPGLLDRWEDIKGAVA